MAFTPIDPNKAEVRITGSSPDYGLDFYIPKGERGDIGPTGPQGPAVPTNLQIGTIEVGAPAPGTVGPQGLTGPKGDPGGFSTPVTIAATTDLNSIITAGLYQASGTSVVTSKNYPVTHDAPFQMSVYTSSTTTGMQVAEFNYAVRAGKVQYHRTWSGSGSTWTPWVSYSTSRVDQTAGRVIYQWDDVNAREQLIYGDTGTRDLTSYYGATAGSVQISRQMQSITLVFADAVLGTLSGTQDLAAPPAGFGPPVNSSFGLFNGSIWLRAFVASAAIRIYGLTSGVTLNGVITYRTNQSWPTTLPGTAVGTIPNV